MAYNDFLKFKYAATVLGATKNQKTLDRFFEGYQKDPERYYEAAQGMDYAKNVYGNEVYGYDSDQLSAVKKQYDYYKKRVSNGYDPIEIADLNWDPRLYDDATNEAYASWYKSNKSLPSEYQAAEFNTFKVDYKAKRDATDLKDMYTLAGYDKAGTTALKFNKDWQKYGYDYDMTDANDIRRKQLGMPPASFLALYTTDGILSSEDSRRFESGELPVVLDPMFRSNAQSGALGADMQMLTKPGNREKAATQTTQHAGTISEEEYASYTKNRTVDQLKSDTQAIADYVKAESAKPKTITTAAEGSVGVGVNPYKTQSEGALYGSATYDQLASDRDKTAAAARQKYDDETVSLITNAPTTQQNIENGRVKTPPTGKTNEYQAALLTAAQRAQNVENQKTAFTASTQPGATAGDAIQTGNAIFGAGDEITTFNDQGATEITKAEADIINSYYGIGDYDTGNRMFRYFKNLHANAAETADIQKRLAETSTAGKIAMSVFSSLPQMVQGAEVLKNAASKSQEPVAYTWSGYLSNMAAAAESDLLQGIDDPTTRYIAKTGLNIAKMLPLLATGEVAAPILMGLSTAGQTATQSFNAGASKWQQIFQSVSAGVAEGLFEKWSLGALSTFKAAKYTNVMGFFTELGKLAGVNIQEEIATDVANMLSDEVIMSIFRNGGSRSQLEIAYDQRIAKGDSSAEARKNVSIQTLIQFMDTAVQASAMAVALGGVGVASNYVTGANVNTQANTAQPQQTAQDVTGSTQAQGEAITPATQQNAAQSGVEPMAANAAVETQAAQPATEQAAPVAEVKEFVRPSAKERASVNELLLGEGVESPYIVVQEKSGKATSYKEFDTLSDAKADASQNGGTVYRTNIAANGDYRSLEKLNPAYVAAQEQTRQQTRNEIAATIETLPEEQRAAGEAVLAQWDTENPVQQVENQSEENTNFVTLNSNIGEISADIATDEQISGLRASNPDTNAEMSRLEAVAKISGVNVRYAHEMTSGDKKVTGLFDPKTNTITVALDAKNKLNVVAAHEIMHALEGTEAYDKLAQYAVQRARDRGTLDDLMEQARELYGDKPGDYLQREIVADTMMEVFDNKREFNRFINNNRGIVGKIINAIDSFIERIKGMSEAQAELRTLRDMFEAAVAEKPVEQPGTDVRAYIEREGVATVLTKITEPRVPLRTAFATERDAIIRKFADSGTNIDRIGKSVGDLSLYETYDWAHRSRAIAENMISQAQFDINGNRVGDSLMQIFEPINKEGDAYKKLFYEYMFHKHNVDRMTLEDRGYGENKPVFGKSVTAEDSQEFVDETLKTHPEFEKRAETVYKYNHNLMQWRIDSGLISKENAALLNKMYPHYVPTFRETSASGGLQFKNKTVAINQGINRAVGSNKPLLPIDISIARQTLQAISAAKRNQLALKLDSVARKNWRTIGNEILSLDTVKEEGGIEAIAEEMLENDPAATPDNAKTPVQKENTFIYYKNGKKLQMNVSKGVAEGLTALSSYNKDYTGFIKTANSINNSFKRLVTGLNPIFAVRNPIRDIGDAMLYAERLPSFAKNWMPALKELVTNSDDAQLYRAMGGFATTIFDYKKGLIPKASVMTKIANRLENVNMLMEQATRFAEFKSVIEREGRSTDAIRRALYSAAEITVNFNRSGTWGRALNATFVPFFNPSVQGLSKIYRAFGGPNGWKTAKRTMVRAVLFGIAPALLNHLLLGDDKDYEDLPDRIKWANWVFKVSDDQFIIVPRGRVMSVFALGADSVADMLDGKKKEWAEPLEFVVDQVAPVNPLTGNIFAPTLAVGFNKAWYGLPIESDAMQNLAPAQRYDEKTDSLSKWLGNVFKYSPKKINYLLDSYTGVIGDLALPLLTPYAEQNGFVKAFKVDSVLSSKTPNDFYDAIQDLTENSNELDAEPATSYALAYMKKQAKQVSEINKEIRNIQNSTVLTDKEKRDQTRDLKEVSIGIMAEALRALPTYTEIATAHNPADGSDERVRAEIDYDAFGADYALQNYSKATYEKAKEAAQYGVSMDEYYNAYFAIKDIKDQYEGDDNADTRRSLIVKYVTSKFKTQKERDAIYGFIAGYSTSGKSPSRTSTADAPKRVGIGATGEAPKRIGIK